MPTFEGCKVAREISLTRKAANPHAVALVLKSALSAEPADGGKPQTETTDMPTAAEIQKAALAITKSMAAMNDVTKAYFLGLGDDASVAFLEKSLEDQTKEAETAKAAADRAAAEAEAVKAGKTVEVVSLEKRVSEQDEVIKGLLAKDADREIEKRALTDFAGFPGGTDAAVEMLKSFKDLPDAARTKAEDMMKAQCALGAATSRTYGDRSEADVTKAAGAKARLVDAAKAHAEVKKTSFADAMEVVMEKREFAADVEACEEAGIDIFAQA